MAHVEELRLGDVVVGDILETAVSIVLPSAHLPLRALAEAHRAVRLLVTVAIHNSRRRAPAKHAQISEFAIAPSRNLARGWRDAR